MRAWYGRGGEGRSERPLSVPALSEGWRGRRPQAPQLTLLLPRAQLPGLQRPFEAAAG